MNCLLPAIPNFVFTIFEPLSLTAGAIGAVYDPEWFVAEQIAFSPLSKLSANARVVTLQLGSIYFLLAMVGLAVLSATKEPKVVRNYVIALAVADVTHLAVTYSVLEHRRFTSVAQWNAMAYGNILVTVCIQIHGST